MKSKIAFVMLVLWLFEFSVSEASFWQVPANNDVLYSIGRCNQSELSDQFSILIWNIKKAEFKAKWRKDFDQLAEKSDLVLLQEAMLDDYVPKVVGLHFDKCWNFATSFVLRNGERTGVMSGANATAASLKFFRSPGRELWVATPKMTLVSEYRIAGRAETLMVANIHALNFTNDGANSKQVEEVLSAVQSHEGPIIFAGDFNSWSPMRLKKIDKLMSAFGLKKITLANDVRSLKLDHIYFRGLSALEFKIHSDVRSSDHYPVSMSFEVLK